MDTKFLESFIAVVDCGSIAEAARRLNLTPAGITQRIRALENEIGSPLISRSGRTVRATEGGAAILDHGRQLLARVRDLGTIVSNDRPVGQLRIGAFQTALVGLVPDILRQLVRQHEKIDIHIVSGNSPGLYNKLIEDRIDAAIIVRPPFAIPKSLEWRMLREEPLIAIAPTSVTGSNVRALLTSEPYISLDHNSWVGRLVDSYLRHARIRPRERFELEGIIPIAVMVDRGLRMSVIPDWARPWPEALSLAKFALPANPFALKIGLMWNRSSVRSRLVHAFLDQALIATKARKTRRGK